MIVSDEVSRREGWTNEVFQDLQVKADLGRYRIRGFSTFQRIAHFDDIIFLPRYLSGKGAESRPADVSTETVLGTRYARNAISISTPVYITGMSYGALSRSAKTALAKGAAKVGTATCTGDGGMLREETDWRVPVQVKIPACRVKDDVKLAAKAGADGIVIDGMQAGTGASSEVVLDHSGIPTLPGIVLAREALEELGLLKKVYLVASGGIRNGIDAAKAIALGADAVAIGQAAIIALNCNRELPGITDFVREVGVPAGYCTKCHTGKCPVGITTQDPRLEKRLAIDEAAVRVASLLSSMTLEMKLITCALGKRNVHDLTVDDLSALNVEASMMAKVPMVGSGGTLLKSAGRGK